MTLPPMPPLPEPGLAWWPAMTEDYQQALRAWARTYAEQYGRLCAEAERAEIADLVEKLLRAGWECATVTTTIRARGQR